MVKTVKLQLFYADDETLEFHKAQEELWELQKEVRSASNRMIQMCWEYNGFESDWKKQTGKYPTKNEGKEALGGKTLAGIIYNRAKEDAPNLNTSDLSTTSQLVIAKFNSMKADIMRGTASIPSFKRNLPIDLHKKAIKLTYEEDVNGAIVRRQSEKREYKPRERSEQSEVGYRIGAAIRKSTEIREKVVYVGEHGKGSPKSPHIRRSHFHSYWTGSGDSKELIVKWVNTIFVHGGDGNNSTVHNVK